MMNNTEDRMREFALLGARARIRELESEIADIRRVFPELSKAEPSREVTQAQPAHQKPARQKPARQKLSRRKRPSLSPEARKASSERMRKYWEERRQSSASDSDAQPQASASTAVSGVKSN
jgi:hypothetical protein